METVVALAIFTVAATYSLAIFVQSNTVQKRTANIQRALSDARYALEVIAREVRMGQIDYSYYETPLGNMPLAILAIIDPDNNQLIFRRAESELGSERFVIQFYDTEGEQWLDITPEDLNVIRLDFYITPAENPFLWQPDGGYANNQQPMATIILETESLHSEGNIETEPRVTHFQTTITSRKYSR